MTIHAQGLRAWLLQRITAVYIAAFVVVILVWGFISGMPAYEQWRELIAHPVLNMAIALFILSILFHSWVGVRDILVDYVHPVVLRVTALVLLGTFLFVMGIWALMILFSVVKL